MAALEQARAMLDHEEKPATHDRAESDTKASPPVATVAGGLVQLARTGPETMAIARPEAARRAR